MAISKITLTIMTLRRMTFCRMTHSRILFRKITIMTLGRMTLRRMTLKSTYHNGFINLPKVLVLNGVIFPICIVQFGPMSWRRLNIPSHQFLNRWLSLRRQRQHIKTQIKLFLLSMAEKHILIFFRIIVNWAQCH